MTDRYAVVPLHDLVGYEIPGQARWHLIRSTLDVRAFGINASTEEWDEAIGMLEGHLAETPDNAGVFYNLACANARAGHTEEALDRLTHAVELQPTSADHAQTDDDLAAIRGHERFPGASKEEGS